jgi:hypothetical protein
VLQCRGKRLAAPKRTLRLSFAPQPVARQQQLSHLLVHDSLRVFPVMPDHVSGFEGPVVDVRKVRGGVALARQPHAQAHGTKGGRAMQSGAVRSGRAGQLRERVNRRDSVTLRAQVDEHSVDVRLTQGFRAEFAEPLTAIHARAVAAFRRDEAAAGEGGGGAGSGSCRRGAAAAAPCMVVEQPDEGEGAAQVLHRKARPIPAACKCWVDEASDTASIGAAAHRRRGSIPSSGGTTPAGSPPASTGAEARGGSDGSGSDGSGGGEGSSLAPTAGVGSPADRGASDGPQREEASFSVMLKRPQGGRHPQGPAPAQQPAGGAFGQLAFRPLDLALAPPVVLSPLGAGRARFAPRCEWELDPRKVLIGRRLAVGGFAEVFIGKYEVRLRWCVRDARGRWLQMRARSGGLPRLHFKHGTSVGRWCAWPSSMRAAAAEARPPPLPPRARLCPVARRARWSRSSACWRTIRAPSSASHLRSSCWRAFGTPI